jgi:DNA-directed RNA polymerase specialized sigma24 family protein
MDVLRANGREKANGRVAVGRAADHGEREVPLGPPQPSNREHDPATIAEQSDLHALLRALIDDLPTNQREALDLWADGFNYDQIATITNHSPGHIRVLVHRGLKTLREHPRITAIIDDEPALARSASERNRITEPTPVRMDNNRNPTLAQSASAGD